MDKEETYTSMYTAYDKLMKRLPSSVVDEIEDAQQEFINGKAKDYPEIPEHVQRQYRKNQENKTEEKK